MKRSARDRDRRRHDVGAERFAESRIVLERVRIGLADQFARHIRMVEPLGDPMHHRPLERVVMQDRGIDEARKLRLRRATSSASSRIRCHTGSTLSSRWTFLSCCWAMSASTLTGVLFTTNGGGV